MSDNGTDVTCHICGGPIQAMVADPRDIEDAYVALKGQWMWIPELDAALFVLDQDSELTVMQLDNGQLAILPDEHGRPTIHHHSDCYDRMTNEEVLSWEELDELERTG